MRLFGGTNGDGDKEWKGAFYPAKFPADEMLRCDAGLLVAMEIDNTSPGCRWRRCCASGRASSPAFRFVLKA